MKKEYNLVKAVLQISLTYVQLFSCYFKRFTFKNKFYEMKVLTETKILSLCI